MHCYGGTMLQFIYAVYNLSTYNLRHLTIIQAWVICIFASISVSENSLSVLRQQSRRITVESRVYLAATQYM